MFLSQIKKFSSSTIFIDENNKNIKYFEILKLNSKINKIVKKKSLIFIVSENSIESLMGYVSILISKALIMPINNQISNLDFEILRNKYQPSYIWCNKNFLEDNLNKFFKPVLKFENYLLLESVNKKEYPIKNSLKILLSTSGSLSEPKCVKLTNKNLKHNTISIDKYLNLKPKDRTITSLPWSYSYGMSIINTHIYKGASILITKKSLLDKEFWNLLIFGKVTNFNGVPFLYEIIKKIGFEKLFNSNLRFITQAGGKMNINLFQEIIKLCCKKKIKFFSMYGQTEASPRMSFIEKTRKKTEANCIGKSIFGGSFYLRDKNNKKVKKIRQEGELIFKGKNIFVGYSKSFKDLNKNKTINVLKTGDIGFFDRDKNYYLTGRKSRFIKFAGIRTGLDTIEEKLRLRNIVCATLNHKDILYIFIENINKINDLKKIISKIIKIRHNEFELKYLNNFPRNSNNKMAYNKLTKFLQNDK